MSYCGFKSWSHWNVFYWLNKDKELGQVLQDASQCPGSHKFRAKILRDRLADKGVTRTPEGAPFTETAIRAAMRVL